MSLSTGATYQYDGNGNMTAGDGRSQTFDYLDRPTVVTKDTTTTKFRYAPDGSRYLQYTVTSSARTTTYYVDKLAEHVTSTTISTGAQIDTDRSYAGPAVVITSASGVGRAVNYLHLDRLGSVQSITGPTAAEVMTDAHGMDAFGKPRDREWMDNGSKLHPSGGGVTNHGFTGHEHLDDTYLIHMNGRVYDYRLGRFLSVDPIISNPANSQSINPYSYIGNNPLSGVDPTGYDGSCVNDAPLCKASMWKKELEYSPSSGLVTSSGPAQSSGAQPQGKTIPTGSPSDTGAPGDKQPNSGDGGTRPKPDSGSQAQAIRARHPDVDVPDDIVPLTPDLNRLAVSLKPQINERPSSGKEESLTSNSDGTEVAKAPASSCDDASCSTPIVRNPAVAVHRHVKDAPDTNDPGDRIRSADLNRQREMPGPRDHQMLLRGIPSYIQTPSGRFIGFEYNIHDGSRDYFYREIGPRGEFASPPKAWDIERVK
jgi:RHS repeat-associated protein